MWLKIIIAVVHGFGDLGPHCLLSFTLVLLVIFVMTGPVTEANRLSRLENLSIVFVAYRCGCLCIARHDGCRIFPP